MVIYLHLHGDLHGERCIYMVVYLHLHGDLHGGRCIYMVVYLHLHGDLDEPKIPTYFAENLTSLSQYLPSLPHPPSIY